MEPDTRSTKEKLKDAREDAAKAREANKQQLIASQQARRTEPVTVPVADPGPVAAPTTYGQYAGGALPPKQDDTLASDLSAWAKFDRPAITETFRVDVDPKWLEWLANALGSAPGYRVEITDRTREGREGGRRFGNVMIRIQPI